MEYDPEDPDKFVYDTSNFHIYNPACSPLVLEFVVMNNENDKASEKHLNNVYDAVKKMVLENADDEDKITKYNDENDEYTSGPMNNFDEVNYTSPLKLIDDFVINGDYFNVYMLVFIYYFTAATTDISTNKFSLAILASTQALAGLFSPKNSAYTSFIKANSFISFMKTVVFTTSEKSAPASFNIF